GLLAVSLIALEVVDGGANLIVGPLVRADGVDGMPDHLQGLEGHHDLVILNVVTYEHQNLFCHCSLLLLYCWGKRQTAAAPSARQGRTGGGVAGQLAGDVVRSGGSAYSLRYRIFSSLARVKSLEPARRSHRINDVICRNS